MRWLVVVLLGGLVGLRTWVALCSTVLAAMMLLVAALDSDHGPRAGDLHHDGVVLLGWTWGIWAVLTVLRRRRR